MVFAATSLDNTRAREVAIDTLARCIAFPIVFLWKHLMGRLNGR
jgi:hypothetical protein